MSKLLLIDSSSLYFSVALSDGLQIIASKLSAEKNQAAAAIQVYVQELLSKDAVALNEIEAVVLCNGPGSYTGLRIGAAFAKGFCYAMQIPLISISKLKVMATQFINAFPHHECKFVCPMIDARRMEVYMAVFDKNKNEIVPQNPYILTSNQYTFDFENTIFIGDGAEKIKHIEAKAIVDATFQVEAADFLSLALQKFNEKQFEQLAVYEPDYFKPFYSTAKPQTYS